MMAPTQDEPDMPGYTAAFTLCSDQPMLAREREAVLVAACGELSDWDAFAQFLAATPAHNQRRRAGCLFDLVSRERGQRPEESAFLAELKSSLNLSPEPFVSGFRPSFTPDLVSREWGYNSAFDMTRLRRLLKGENL